MGNNLKALRERLKLKQGEFSSEFNIPQTTYSGYETGMRDPRTDFWIAVSDKYQVSTDYLLGQTDDPHGTKYPADVSPLEAKYNGLDDHGRRVVDLVMDAEADRCAEPVTPETVESGQDAAPKTKIIPLILTAAAAGPGEWDTGLGWAEWEVPADSSADFAVRISGDSMEPELHDGETVLCVRRWPEIGEIAVVMVDGFLLVKQFITDSRNIFLRSINRARDDQDRDIWHTGNETVTFYGVVIHKKIPLADQWG